MAGGLTVEELRGYLAKPEAINGNGFTILKNLASIAANGEKGDLARELVLRALEVRTAFRGSQPILESIVRSVGLFPYADQTQLGLRESIAYEYHRPLGMPEDFVFHREQAEVYWRLLSGDSVVLSAPTSFGKSRIIDAIIATGKFKSIAVIVPTLALIDETRRRMAQYSDKYKIVTQLSQKPSERTIFVFTAERAISYKYFSKVEFFVIDEFYKIDAQRENDQRTVALNIAFHRLVKMGGQFYLLGPNVERIPRGFEEKYRCYFYPTQFSTVVSEQVTVEGEGDELARLVGLCQKLTESTLIFCSSPSRVNTVANHLLDHNIGVESRSLAGAAEWGAKTYHPDWIWSRALRKGIGVHHGRLPRSLGQYTVRMFNELTLRFLICTSTLIEGVNTKAKNVVIFDNEIARRKIDFFTFNNIKGRSGRMFEHFVGRVYLFDPPPQESLPFVDFPVFSQGKETPNSLIVQIENEDLTNTSKERVKKWNDQDVLPVGLLRENAAVDPERQLALAEQLGEDARNVAPLLAWNRIPTTEQLNYACELIWKYLLERRIGGVFSAAQLAFRIWELRRVPSSAERIAKELSPGKYAAKTADEAVERVLQFERVWAGWEFPRYLSTLSSIQAHVLRKLRLGHGNYGFFASQVQSLFRNPVVGALDEYGIPLQIAERLEEALDTPDDLDAALKNLKASDLAKLGLSEFEQELVEDARRYL